jgi:hypothetical protein
MDDLGWPSRHRRGCAPGQLRGVERCILLAQRRLARNCDEVMGDKADANHVLDPALAQERLSAEASKIIAEIRARKAAGTFQPIRQRPSGALPTRACERWL